MPTFEIKQVVAILNLEFRRGSDFSFKFICECDLDLTPYTIRYTAKRDLDDEDSAAIISCSTASGEIVLEGIVLNSSKYIATYKINIPSTQTKNLESKVVKLKHDIQADLNGSSITPLAEGVCRIIPEATRNP
jgi:hypothetical protein